MSDTTLTEKMCRGCDTVLPIHRFERRVRRVYLKWEGRWTVTTSYAPYCTSCDRLRFKERMARKGRINKS